jgi:outer membrane protein assembly factor BamA
MRILAVWVWLGLLVATRPVFAEGEKIVEIKVVGNTKTNQETVLLIADVEVGDRSSASLILRVKTDLVNSGLFKEVEVYSAPVLGGVVLTLDVADKMSWVIAPTFYNQPGNTGVGVGYGENNLFGENKKLLLYGQIATADSLFFGVYLDPSIAGTPLYWRVDSFARHENVTEYTTPEQFDVLDQPTPRRVSTMNYLNNGLLVGVNAWRGFAFDARLRAAYVYFTDANPAEDTDLPDKGEVDEVPQDDGWDVTSEYRLIFDKRANWYGVTTGRLFQLSYERAELGLGSDVDYWIASTRLVLAYKYYKAHNWIIKAFAGTGYHLPFQQEFTSGGVALRGYKNRQFRGDTKASLNLEYSVPLFTVGPFALRLLSFVDSAYTTFLNDTDGDRNSSRHYLEGQTDNKLSQFRLGVGGGFRIYVRSIVLPLLGVDWGYAPGANDYQVYFAVGLTEL